MKRIINKFLLTISAFVISFAVLCQGIGVTAFALDMSDENQHSTARIDGDFADDRILVVMDKQSTMNFRSYSTDDFSEVGVISVNELTKSSSEVLRRQIDFTRIGQSTRRKSMEINVDKFRTILCLTIEHRGKENVLNAIRVLEQRSDVISAEPDSILHIESTNPNDPRFLAGDQWGLNGTNGINVPLAWQASFGVSTTVRVGVIDTGIDASHPDLNVNIGMSRDFSLADPYIPTSVTDTNGHGTHVAGIIGARGNNSIGVTGVCQDIELISLKISPTNLGNSFASHLISAIEYATTAEIPILSNSNGTDNFIGTLNSLNAVETAIDAYPGLFVTSAGNAGKNNDNNDNRFPSNIKLPNVISVGASDKNGNRSNWNGFENLWGLFGLWESSSNWGATMVDIFAPGTDILSTMPNNKYQAMSGTSMATPFVSGVAALLLSHNENLTTSEIKDAIMDNVTSVAGLNGLCVTGGRLNASAAIRSIGYLTTPIGNDEIRIDEIGFNPTGTLVIPEQLNGRTVTQIGNDVFDGQGQLTHITIPNSVTSLSNNTFHNNTSVYWLDNYAFRSKIFLESLNEQTEFTIPNIIAGKTITGIDEYAFANNTTLTKVTIPSSIAYIGDHAFSNCTNLAQVDITDETTSILGSTPFSGCTQLYGTILSIKTGYHRTIDNTGRLIWMAHDFVYDGSYSSTHHDLVCQSCGYEDTKTHNKQVVNGIDVCSVCPWVGDVHTNHEHTYSYIPIPHSGKFPVNLHKAYCFCDEYIEEMCLGQISSDGKAYCIYCHRDMSGALGPIINRILLPESEFHEHDICYIDDCHLNDCCITKSNQNFCEPNNVLYIEANRKEKKFLQ